MTTEESTDPGQVGDVDGFTPTDNTFTPAQERKLAEWAVEDGTLSREEANDALRASGLDPLDAPANVDPDSAAGQIDAAFPPAEPNDYELPPLIDEGEPYDENVQALDEARRQWLAAARLPKGIGESIVRHIHESAANYRTLDQDARQLQYETEIARVREHFGDDADRMIGLAAKLTDEIDAVYPGLKKVLEDTGAANSRYVVIQLALQADRLAARRG